MKDGKGIKNLTQYLYDENQKKYRGWQYSRKQIATFKLFINE